MRAIVALAAVAMFGTEVVGMAAYLPAVGPSPLRYFEAPAPLVASAPAGEPLKAAPTNNNTANATNAATLPDAASTNAAGADSITNTAKSPDTVAEILAASSLTNRSFSLIGGASETNFITPQMMLYFFQDHGRGTNGPYGSVALPIEFIPPIPFQRPPSKAAFQSP